MSGWKHDRRSRHERGYGAAWDRIRPVILKRDNYLCQCEDCKAADRIRPATHVDHIVSKADWQRRFGSLEGVDAPTNLRAINKDCHERKSQREKGNTVRAGASVSGMPLDPAHPWNTNHEAGS